MTSEPPSTSKADPGDANAPSGDAAARTPARARTQAPSRPAPRSRPARRPASAAPENSGAAAETGGAAGTSSDAPGARPAPRGGAGRRPAGPRPGGPTPRPQPFRNRRLEETPGPQPDQAPDQVRLAVGVIVGIHGLKGELKLQLWTDTPAHLQQVRRVWVGEEREARRLTGVRLTPDRALIRLGGVGTPETARTFVGQQLFIAGSDARPLDEGELFLYQIVGLRVVTESGETLGTIADVMETGANDVLVIRPEEGGADVLFPHHRDFVLGVDLDAGTMTVRQLDYLN